ncbi:FG-GAP-like repeat-containing protein [Actinoplanes sp. CA-252034]|uniref:FG-GAP-like repeat-containing protein n=1 Tax=Actinoplanes sp. CA-252034 TaxID=3239906 RepID=UPI003D993ECF
MTRRRSAQLAVALAAVAAVTTIPGSPSAAVTGGSAVADGDHRFAVHLTDGVSHGCTGTLVSPYWILTAKDCVTGTAGPIKAQIGKANLTTSAGHDRTVVRSVTHPTLDLALSRITLPVNDITFPRIGATPVAAGESLTILGYGRTNSSWVGLLHQATVAVTGVEADTLAIANVEAGAPTTCKGDAGGPTIRQTPTGVEVVAVHSTSYQGGCLGETATRRDAVETRLDVAAPWITATIAVKPRTDFNDDGRADIAGINPSNDMVLYTGDGAGKVSSAAPMWATGGLWAGSHAFTAGDFNGDGFNDIAIIDSQNNMRLYAGDGAGKLTSTSLMWATGGLWAGSHAFTSGDFNSDGILDIAIIDSQNSMRLYTNDGTGKLTQKPIMFGAAGAWVNHKAFTGGDFDSDGKADIAVIDSQNSMRLYSGDGAGKLIQKPIMFGAAGAWVNHKAFTGGDFDSDGKADIAVIDSQNNLRLYSGDGAGKLIQKPVMFGGSGAWADWKWLAS